MDDPQDRRSKHRRFTDRRVQLLLDLYEIFFDEPKGPERTRRLLDAIKYDFEPDIAAIVEPSESHSGIFRLVAANGDWVGEEAGRQFTGVGIESLIETHHAAPGAVTYTRVRRPASIDSETWEALWAGALGERSKALLSVELEPVRAHRSFLWLVQTNYSREWNSQDRELAEEISSLLTRAADKEFEE